MGGFGTTLGHDFVLRLGDDGLTPDGSLIGRQAAERLFERYLRGPADVVWEVVLPGHERQDREVKRRLYESGGVPHYWIIDPQAQTVDLLRLVGGHYQKETPGADGRYRPAAVRGLALVPARLWQESSARDVGVLEVESPLPKGWTFEPQPGVAWDDLPFEPRPELEPMPLGFDEFAAWCPRARFEGYDGRTIIGGRLGTRNVLGMLLRTFGLTEAVTVLHPRAWVAGLAYVEEAERSDAERKARWWNLARQAAARLRAQYRLPRIGVIGSLTHAQPLHFWSELSLVVWELPCGTFEAYDLLRDLDTERVLDLIAAERATATEQRMIADEAIEIP